MIADVQLYLAWLLVTATVYWLIPAGQPIRRVDLLLLSSAVLIALVAPWAAVIAVYVIVATFLWARYFVIGRPSVLLFLAIATLIAPLLLQKLDDDVGLIATLGVGFLTLKAVATLVKAAQRRTGFALRQVALQILFVPSFSAGPVEPIETFQLDALPSAPDTGLIASGVVRIALGLFKSLFIADTLIRGALDTRWLAGDGGDGALAMETIALSFAYTYLNFSAYMDIALGSASLFSIRLMENFNHPYLATSLVNFWKRWHITLGKWTGENVYIPFIVRFRHPAAKYLGFVLAFVVLGLWHAFTWNYFLWGLFHGVGLAAVHMVRLRWPRKTRIGRVLGSRPLSLVAWAFTLFYVALVQTIANLPDIQMAGRLALALVSP